MPPNLRDWYVVADDTASLLFFPRSYRLFRIAPEEGRQLIAWHGGESAAPPPRFARLLEAEAGQPIPADAGGWGDTDNLCLYVAHDCNLRCTYCYNRQGRVAAPGRMMDPAVAEAAFRRFFTMPGKRYSVAMYGGEPLLNFSGIQSMIERGRRLAAARRTEVAFSITTNGMLLNRRRIDYLAANFSSISVSVDGPPADHDRFRIAPKGSAYARMVRHLPALKNACGNRLSLLGTLTGRTAERYAETLAHLRQLGGAQAALSPVEGNTDNPSGMNDAQFAAYSCQHARRCSDAIAGGLEHDAPREAVNVVVNLLTQRRLRRFCAAGANPAVAADGSLYACHGLVGDPRFYMGSVTTEADGNWQRVQGQFAALEVDRMAACASCWARYLCGGQCYAQAYFHSGDVARPDPRYCRHVRRSLEASLLAFHQTVSDATGRHRLYLRARQLIGAGGEAPHV